MKAMKALLPFWGMGLITAVMAATTQGQPTGKEQPTVQRSQAHVMPQEVSKPLSKGSPFEGMSDQAIANKIAADLGVKELPTVLYACSYSGRSGFAGKFDPQRNRVILCPPHNSDSATKEFVIAHELGHALEWQQNPSLKKFSEPFADKTAIDYFDQLGYLAPIKANADNVTGGEYATGRKYAQQVLKRRGVQ